MKFLLDENISLSLYEYLLSLGFDVKRVGTDTYQGLTDEEVLDLAVNEERVLLTRDCGDIGEIIFQNELFIKGVICFKENIRSCVEISAFEYIRQSCASLEGKFIIVRKTQKGFFEIRIRDI